MSPRKSALTERFEFDPPLRKCCLCGSTDLRPYHEDFNGIRISRCAGCGVQMMNPQYTDRHLERYYAQYAWEETPELKLEDWLQSGHNFYLSLVEKSRPAKGKLLDVGAGAGGLLMAAKERGWAPTGYDVKGKITQLAARQWGLPYVFGDFTKVRWKASSFDAVTLHQVLEHLKAPESYLKTIHRLLKPEGVLFLGVPNIGSLSSRFKFFLEKAGLRKKKVGSYYDTHHHLWYFTPRPLVQALENQGFKVVHCRSGHQVRPGQSHLKRFFMRHVTERFAWKSSFILIAVKRG